MGIHFAEALPTMKSASLFALLFLVTVAVDARPGRGRGRDLHEKLFEDNAAVQWFLIEQGQECTASTSEPNSITIPEPTSEDEGGHKGKGGPPPVLGQARIDACGGEV